MVIVIKPMVIFGDKCLLSYGIFKQSGYVVFSVVIASISFNRNTLCLCLCLPYIIEGALFIRILKN
jgi:hypothetical protein